MSLRDPQEFATDLNGLEEVERASLRLVCYAVHNLLPLAADEFAAIMSGGSGSSATSLGAGIGDRANYLGEDLTRMAMDTIGMPRVPGARLFGAIDYKVATIAFMPEFAVEQALFVDSKAEKDALNNARIQVTQTSLEIRQERAGVDIAIPGIVEPVWTSGGHTYLTTTLFVKYHYADVGASKGLKQITVAALPHGFLQNVYNPTARDNIWNAGPDAPSLGEKFRTRLNFNKLENKALWRIQRMRPGQPWSFRS